MAGEVRALLAAGVDGVITDHPEEALSVVREQRGDRRRLRVHGAFTAPDRGPPPRRRLARAA